jgi:hypothetical protein
MLSILVVVLASIAVFTVDPQKTFAFVPGVPNSLHNGVPSIRLSMAIDYNDPVVAEEFANVQPMDFDDVEAELRAKGIPVPATLSYVARLLF